MYYNGFEHLNGEGAVLHQETYTYTYDGWGRPKVTTHKLGSGSAVTLHSRTYDMFGREVSDSRNGNTALNTQYTYNVRSYPLSISVGSSGSTFSETLYYESGRNGASVTSPQWGGNISRMDWKTGSDAASRYMFGGKEWDAGISLYDFSARMYNPAQAAFTTLDPLAEKYYYLSPYSYCAGNPVNLIDPEGKKVIIKGSEEFLSIYKAVRSYLEEKGIAESISLLEKAKDFTLIIREGEQSTFDANLKSITWDPNHMMLNEDKSVMRSPTVSLAHEIEHAVEYYTNKNVFINNVNTPDALFSNLEEKRNILEKEQYIANALGEIDVNQVTRHSHFGYKSRIIRGISPYMQSRIAFLYNHPLQLPQDVIFPILAQ